MIRRRLPAAALGSVLLLAGCGDVRTEDQGEVPEPSGALTVHIDPCAVVELDEMSTATGVPLDVERIQIWDESYYCEWIAGDAVELATHRHRGWAEFEVSRTRAVAEVVRLEDAEGAEEIPGLGALARWFTFDDGYGELQVVTPAGAMLWLRWNLPSAITPAVRERIIELARTAIARVDPMLPGDASALPAPTAPVINPCRAIPDVVMRQVLGFTGGSAQREYIGGSFGGHWFCERIADRDGSFDILGVRVMKASSTPAEMLVLSQPVPELGPDAAASFLPPIREGDKISEPAALAFLGPDDHVVLLTYDRAAMDDAWHLNALVELARAFGDT